MPDKKDLPPKEPDLVEVANMLTEHLALYNLHRREYLERQSHQDATQEKTMLAINDLTTATKGLVDAWTVANGFNKFIAWVSKFAVVATFALYMWGKYGAKFIRSLL